MAFNNVGEFWLDPGYSVRISIAREGVIPDEEWGGHDLGAQWIMADGIGIAPAVLMVTEHTKEKKPIRRHPQSLSPIAYTVTVTNIGSEPAHFSLQGGGNA